MTDDPDRVKTNTHKIRKMHEGIGRAITDWVWVEDGLVKLLSTLLGCPLEQAGIIWYSVVSFNAKLDMLDSLVKHAHADKPVMNYWPSCQDYLRKLSGYRNQIVHWELVLLRPPDSHERPFGPGSEPRMVPQNFDVRPKMFRFREEAGLDVDRVDFYGALFNHIGHELRELWLALADKTPWPDKFSQALERPQSLDDLFAWNYKEH